MTDKKISLPLVFDGAMGTYYQSIAKNPLPLVEMANLFDKETILEIHKEYVEAGAQAIKTNTYRANIHALNTGFDVVERIIRSAIGLAKEASAGTGVHIFASIGSIGPEEFIDIKEYYDIIDIFLDEGIHNFLFETYEDIGYLPDLAAYIKERAPEGFILTSFAINADGQTRKARQGTSLISQMDQDKNVDAVGFNCISGPLRLYEYLSTMDLPSKPMSIMPNGGYPTLIKGKTVYSSNKEYFANFSMKFLNLGVQILGGCCGTTPKFIKEVVDQLASYERTHEPRKRVERLRLDNPLTDNHLRNKLENNKKVIVVEYDPPKSLDMAKYIEDIRDLTRYDIDGITIADCPVARVRMDASLTAYKIKNEVGIDPIVHMTCRDRNINATKALLLGLNVENILNIILVTGDPIPTAERDEVKSVYQFNSTRLAAYVERLNQETFTNPMFIGGALNINAQRFDLELKRALDKEEAGVKVFYTQPVISQRAIENLNEARQTLSSYVLGGLMPIVSHRNAAFLDAEVSGISVDQDIIDMYKGVEDKEVLKEMAIDIAYDFSQEIEDLIDGYYIITPFDRMDIIKGLVAKIKAQ